MRPSGIQHSIVPIYIAPTADEERITRQYPPEVVYDRYWKGGNIKIGQTPHVVDAIPDTDVVAIDWTIRSLYPILPTDFKRIVVMLLMMHKRPECQLSVFPVEVLLYLLEFALPVKVFAANEPGLFHWLGTAKGTRSFSPPRQQVACFASSIATGNPEVLLSREGGSGYTEPVPNSWVKVDLSPSRLCLCCTHYSYSTRGRMGTPRALRNWEFQGSVDGINWVIIRKHVEDPTIPDVHGGFAVFGVDSKCHFYTQFRVVQTGPNAYRETGVNYWQDNYAQLNFGNFELWGCIFE